MSQVTLMQTTALPPYAHPKGEETELMRTFICLVAECIKTKLHKRQGSDWISDKTWALVGQQTVVWVVGQLSRAEGRRMTRLIWASLRNNRMACTKSISNTIEVELAKGDVQEAFRFLKGWYRAALDTVSCPCPQIMARQTVEWVELYWRCDSP